MSHAEPDKSTLLEKIEESRKAIAALLVPALGVFAVALTPASDGGSAVTGYEWVGIVIVALSSSAVVYGVANKPKHD